MALWNLLEGWSSEFCVYPTIQTFKMAAKVRSHNGTVTLIELVDKHVGSLMECFVCLLFNLVEITTWK